MIRFLLRVFGWLRRKPEKPVFPSGIQLKYDPFEHEPHRRLVVTVFEGTPSEVSDEL